MVASDFGKRSDETDEGKIYNETTPRSASKKAINK